ncbi:MAG: AraC family transcriptional regulator [Clostridia bacterium]|nr:AraC family transcriptional regulator [Clostridia bacterium]
MKKETDGIASQVETYETHIMSELSVIFHVDEVRNKTIPTFNWHENIEILRFLEGRGTVYCNGEKIEAEPGKLVVFSANCMHAVTAEDKVAFDCLILDRETCLSAGVDTSTLQFPPLVEDEKLFAGYGVIKEEIGRTGEYRVAAVRGAVLTFLAGLCRTYAVKINQQKSKSEEGIRRAIRYMREHFDEALTVDDLAAEAGFSKFHFAREFRRVTSYTVVSYLNLIRMEKAKQYMQKSGVTVGAVALACGFNHFSYFAKLFRKQTGMSPSEYLEKLRS